MNFKDIKKSLKEEHSSSAVPDVLSRAKKAPINKLLSGQAPLKAFDKALVVRVLWVAMLVLLVGVIAFFALAILPSGSQNATLAYVKIEVETDEETCVFGFITSGDNMLACVLEARDGAVVKEKLTPGKTSVQNAITDVYDYNSANKVSISVICTDDGSARELANSVKEFLAPNTSASISKSVNAQDDIVWLGTIVSCENQNDIDNLIAEYLNSFAL